MSEPVILISHPVMAGLEPVFAGAGLKMARAWELPDADRAEVRVILHAGEFKLEPEELLALPKLGLVACVSAGYDGVDVAWCRARGLEVTHAEGLNAEDVADHAIGLIIAAWRNIPAGDSRVREGRWRHEDRGLTPQPSLNRRRLGIVGLGHIGVAVARRAEAMRLQISWWGPRDKQSPWPRAESLKALATDSDILLVACRADRANRGLIGREIIEAVGPAGVIVNVARGSLVDEQALIAALKAGKLWRAALDVFETEPTPGERWADVPGVVFSPHTAGVNTEAVPLMVDQAIDNVRRFLAGEPVVSPVAPVET
jgi:lactate dehydrogenase-like 2-hydroxyacid dehydrogenase